MQTNSVIIDQKHKKGSLVMDYDDILKKSHVLGDDFNYYNIRKSYNIAMPSKRNQVYNHPYLNCYPSLYLDYLTFEDQKLAQCQLLYYFMNGILDYQVHMGLKDTLDFIQEEHLSGLNMYE